MRLLTMKIYSCTLQQVVIAILVSATLSDEINSTSKPRSEPLAEGAPPISVFDEKQAPSRLATAHPLNREQWQSPPALEQELIRQKKSVRLIPREAPPPPELILKPSDTDQQKVADSISLAVVTLPPESAFFFSHEPSTTQKSSNETKNEGAVLIQAATNKTEQSVKQSVDASHTSTKTVSSTDKPANQSSTVKADASEPHSQLLLSVQTADGVYGSGSNITGLESASNGTGNQSAVLISNTHEIELVIIAERPREPVPAGVPNTELPLPPSDAPSRRFPMGNVMYPNDTFLGAHQPLSEVYAAHHYWAVYLTMTLLTLSVLAICLVCCTPQGRRDMAITQPKPMQYGQLPPYGYNFSYEMRQADPQETARLNPAVNP